MLVTGSGKIGRTGNHVLRDLACHGWRTVIHYAHSEADARQTLKWLEQQGSSGMALGAELTDKAEVARCLKNIIERYGRLDAVVHTVGNYRHMVHESNVLTTRLLAGGALPYLSKAAHGRFLVFGASGLNRAEAPAIYNQAYFEAKRELLANMRRWARVWIALGVTANMVSPGEMDYSEVERMNLPMGRRVRPEELTRVCRFLLDPDSDSITGQNIEVAGGLNL